MYPFITKNECKDEWTGKDTIGIHIGTWMLFGVLHWRIERKGRTSWQYGVILLNKCFGIAKD